MFRGIFVFAAAIPLFTFVTGARAQSGRGSGAPAPGEVPPGVSVPGGGDPVQNTRIAFPTFQTELGVNDADFTVIVHKLEIIGNAFNQLSGILGVDPGVDPNAGGVRGMEQAHYNRRLGIMQKPAPWQTRHLPPVTVALEELNDVLNDPNAPAEVIKAKLENYRAVRAKYLADLNIAKDSLRAILNQKQEAIMVSYGFLN